jgi:hypothetical protein
MTQAELNREVARATGESVAEIRHLGFVPLTLEPYEREPLTVDWDEVDEARDVVFPCPSSRSLAVA